LPDFVGIPPFIVDWAARDPLRAALALACVSAALWGLFNLDFDGDTGGASDCDGDSGD
jgi:hypothetical protein